MKRVAVAIVAGSLLVSTAGCSVKATNKYKCVQVVNGKPSDITVAGSKCKGAKR